MVTADSGVWRQRYPLAPGGRVVLDVSGHGKVSVVGWNQPDALVEAQMPGGGDPRDRLEVRSRGGTLRVEVNGSPPDLELTLRVPARIDLEVDGGSAPVTVTGVEGRVALDSGSGPFRLVRVAGEVEIDTGSGDVQVQGFTGRRLAIDGGSGDVQLLGVDAPQVEVDTGSGSAAVVMTRLHPRGCYRLKTGSGALSLTLPAEAAARVRLEVPRGGLQVAHGQLVPRGDDEEWYILGNPGPEAPVIELKARQARLAVAGRGDDRGPSRRGSPVEPGGEMGPDPGTETGPEPGTETEPGTEMAQILELVAQGRISPEEGAALLAALDEEREGEAGHER